MFWIASGAFVIVSGALVWRMLGSLAERGGNSRADAAETADQVLAQADAFRVSRHTRGAWDGRQRLKGVEGNDGPG